ncbi:hypothetical protein [Nocardioides zeae]|uniref:hypothetical protein n=1 Tax=Nocardioides zeae TaxID=1457234 RepID=UPI0018852677|nr:hypothetical protein [Nocardioides zeae]
MTTPEKVRRGPRAARVVEPRSAGRRRRAAAARRPVALAEQVAEAVLGVPGVVGLHPGHDGLAVTYFPDRLVTGVRLHLSGCDVHVVTAWEASVGTTTAAVRRAVAPLVGGRIDVTVDEIAPPAPQSTSSERSTAAADRGGSSARASIAAGSTQPSTA